MMASEKISLFVLIRDYPVGLAVTKKIDNLLRYLCQQEVGITVLSYRSKFAQPAYGADTSGIRFYSIGNNLNLWHLHRTVVYYFNGLTSLVKNKKSGHKNIFYSIGPVNIENLLFVLGARVLRYKVIFDVNEDYSLFEDKLKAISRLKVFTTQKLDILTYKWAGAITVVSHHLKKKYEGLTKKPVVLIPVTAAEHGGEEKRSEEEQFLVIYAGTFDTKDGVNTIIEGFLKYYSPSSKARLLLIGKSEQQPGYVEKYRLYKSVEFAGYLPDDEFYRKLKEADVLCMCRTNSSFSNAGFPFKLGEYLATGNPVISTRASDVTDYLTDEDVYFVGFDDSSDISRALKRISENPEEARQIGLNGFKKYKQYFSPAVNGKLLHSLLKSI